MLKKTDQKLEVWLRGPLPEIPALLQPVAHALLQAREEVEGLLQDFPEHLLWERPAKVASPGFHLQHLNGVLDRLFTYARQAPLDKEQLAALAAEGNPPEPRPGKAALLLAFKNQVDQALKQLKATDEKTLTDFRAVGRAQLPSTQLGLYVHAAEHTLRHVGQLLVTVRVLKSFES